MNKTEQTVICKPFLALEYNSSNDSEYIRQTIEFNFKQGEKILISPIGEVVGLDGRTFRIDGQNVLEQTINNGIDLVFEVDHGFDMKYGSAAAGWIAIDSLELRDDGIYGSLELNEVGQELVDKKLFRYTSPAYIMDRNKADRTVLCIDSHSLVNRPNLNKDALNHKNGMESDEIKELNKKLDELTETNSKLDDDLKEANKKWEDHDVKLNEANTTIRDLTIDLAIERNQVLPKDREFCKTLNQDQLTSYIQNNGSQELLKELNKKLDLKKEDNKKDTTIAAAVTAGSKY